MKAIIARILILSFISSQVIFGRGLLDQETGALVNVDYEHHEIHEGDHFTYTEVDGDMDNGDTIAIVLTVPNITKAVHLVLDVTGTLNTKVQLFEGTTNLTTDTLTAYNNNRRSSSTPNLTLRRTAEDSADGTEIYAQHFSINTAGLSGDRGGLEWVLANDTKYMVKVKSNTDNNVVTLRFSWYEH